MDFKSVLRGEIIKVSGGDFRPGAVTIGGETIRLRTREGERLLVPFGAIVSIEPIDEEKRATPGDRIKGLAVGGVVGGMATGALAGGLAASGVAGAAAAGALAGVLTGPVGMTLGAAAGAIYAVKRTFITCRVELRCGLWFIGEAQKKTWTALQYIVARSPAAQAMPIKKIAPMITIPSFRKTNDPNGKD
jgi:hypothetical protein